MRNKFGGPCYRCGEWVPPQKGHFERIPGTGWRVQHATCAIKYRGTDVVVPPVSKCPVDEKRGV